MKKIVLVLAILALTLPALAWSKTKNGGYASMDFRMSEFNGQEVFMAGFTGGVTLNRRALIGFAAYGFAPEMAVINSSGTDSSYIMGGYGGILVEYILRPKKMINFGLSMLGGVGAFVVSPDSVLGGFDYNHIGTDFDYNYSGVDYVSLFLIAEPGISMNINITPWFKIGVNVSYRYTLGADVAGMNDESMRGMNTGMQFKFGAF